MQEGKLYLVFDYLSMDLKKYIDSYGSGRNLEMTTIKSLTYQVGVPKIFINFQFELFRLYAIHKYSTSRF